MKELVILSGKGGTGKTSIAASFAALAENKIMADCDVDAADLHLVLTPENYKEEVFGGGNKAYINSRNCVSCGKCINLCRFDAISDFFTVDTLSCEGCGVCAVFCPADAIEMKPHQSGKWFESETEYGPLVHARLGIAEGNSGKLVTIIRNKAKEIAKNENINLIIADGSPGTGCPVIATVTGSSFVLIVTEPTVSGIHDLKRVHTLIEHFRVRSAVCINRYDINLEKADEIEEFCRVKEIPLFGRIPYDDDVTKAQVAGKSIVEYSSGPAAEAVKVMWNKIKKEILTEGV
ncbi:MAG TPA: ATP-binding protein [Spirochaetota bacterium]|nr:ATP-binding protein [Spirochaetota bacterium]HPS86162.1 ATP-binding protein [Spirochaetota bacterium]